MARPTLRTIPHPNIQRHFIYNMSTVSAAFRAREPSVNFNQFSSVPLAFVGKLSYKLSPSSIANRLGEFMVFDHIFDCQVLNYYRLVFTYQLSCQLMQKVSSTVSYLAMYFGYFEPLFLSVVRPLLFTRQGFLYLFELGAQPFKMLWVRDFVSRTCSNKTRYAHVQTNRFIGFGQWFNNCIYEH